MYASCHIAYHVLHKSKINFLLFVSCIHSGNILFGRLVRFVLSKKKKKKTNKQFVSLSNLFLIAMTLELVAATKFQQSHEQCLTAFVKSFLMMA